jgi:acetyltransferase
MSIRNLERLFRPRSVALIGASKTPGSVGAVLAHNLLRGGFEGPVMPVNPKHEAIEGVLAYRDVASLPIVPDLAVIATPAETVPAIVAALGARGTRAAVVISAGFAEGGSEQGAALQRTMLEAARPHTLRIVGPNCLGIAVPRIGLDASFAHLAPPPGGLAFVAQSGAVVTSVLDWAQTQGVGFSHLVSLGDMADVDFGDMLDYLANDRETSAILLYMEAVTHARKFMSAGRAAARSKPVLVVKAGRYAEGARAAASHTGALAGSDEVHDAAFRRAGMLRVSGLQDLFAAVQTLGLSERPRGDRLAILTNGGGLGVLATDALMDAGGRLADLAPSTLAALDAALPPTWSHTNPVDVVGDAGPERYAAALRTLLDDPGVDAVLVIHCPTAVSSPAAVARAVAEVAREERRAALLASWVGDLSGREARRLLGEAGIPSHPTPELAVRAFMDLVSHRRNQESLMQTPPSVPEAFSPDPARARAAVARALAAGREWLAPEEVEELLRAYAIPFVTSARAASPAEAAEQAQRLGGLVVLKLVSPDVTHKSDVGGVALELAPKAVRAAATAMLDRVHKARPEARVDGFLIQPMVRRPGAFELIVGAAVDPLFGPVVIVGHGGIAVERIADRAIALPPLNLALAREALSRTRIHRLLEGHRGQPGADVDAIALVLLQVSQLVIDVPELSELDLNPLLADASGVLALDARVRVAPAPAADRLAIRPYPKVLEETIALADGRSLLVRPIRPEDEPSLQATFARLSPEEIRLRFFVAMKTLSHVMAARFTQLDYDREMALVLTDPGPAGRTEIYGVVHLHADPDNDRAEYAILVRHDMTGLGLGVLLMRRILDYARSRGIREVFGDVLAENATMRRICREIGFEERHGSDPNVVRVSLALVRDAGPPRRGARR